MSRVKLEPMGDRRPRKGGRDQVHASALSCACDTAREVRVDAGTAEPLSLTVSGHRKKRK